MAGRCGSPRYARVASTTSPPPRHHGVIDALAEIRTELPTLADLGYELRPASLLRYETTTASCRREHE